MDDSFTGISRAISLIDVFQSMTTDGAGTAYPTNAFYRSMDEARKASDGYGPPEPTRHQALLLENGTVWVLDGKPRRLFESRAEFERYKALSKLTPKERELLGLPVELK